MNKYCLNFTQPKAKFNLAKISTLPSVKVKGKQNY